MTLEGRTWRLTDCSQAGTGLAPVPDDVEVIARFEDGTVSGSGGCNRYTAGYAQDGDGVAIGPVGSTMMACPEPRMSIEAAFFAAMPRVRRASDRGTALELLDGDGRPVLRFIAAAVTPLVGTGWTATGINNGRGGVVSILAGTEVTALFADDGRVAGSAGCNRWTASFVVVGSTITIGPPAATRRLCADPEGVMEQETAFLAALPRSSHLRIDGDQLELRDDDDALQAVFLADT